MLLSDIKFLHPDVYEFMWTCEFLSDLFSYAGICLRSHFSTRNVFTELSIHSIHLYIYISEHFGCQHTKNYANNIKNNRWPLVLSFISEIIGGYEQFKLFWLIDDLGGDKPENKFVSEQDQFECAHTLYKQRANSRESCMTIWR